MDYITQLKQNVNPTLNDIDLREICHAFKNIYVGKPYIIETNNQKYRRLEFDIQLSQLHHLLGLHKLSNRKYSKRPERVIDQISNGKITLSDLKKDSEFFQIKDRILMIRLLFLISDNNTEVRLCTPNPKSRIMDFGIIDQKNHKCIVLGVGKNKNNIHYFKTLIIDKHIHSRSKRIKVLKSGKGI